MKEYFIKNKEDIQKVLHRTIAFMIVILFAYLIYNHTGIKVAIEKIIKLLMPFIYGFAIAYIINPLMKFLQEKILEVNLTRRNKKLRINRLKPKTEKEVKISKIIAMSLSYLLMLLMLIGFFFLVIPQISTSITGIAKNIPEIINSIEPWISEEVEPVLEKIISDEEQLSAITQFMSQSFTEFLGKASEIVPALLETTLAITGIVFNLILGFIVSIYMLWNKNLFMAQIVKAMSSVMKERKVNESIGFGMRVHNTVGKFINAKILDSIIIAIICYFGLILLKIDNALLISLIIGVTNLVPFFGPFIGAIPSLLLILFSNPELSWKFLLFVVALQQFDGHILGPRLMGKSLGLTPFWIIFAVVITTGLLGVVGMFLGVPFFAVLYMYVRDKINKKLESKGLSSDTKDYEFHTK